MEQWRDIAGFEGMYQVSSEGRVRSLARVIVRRNGRPVAVAERILSLPVSDWGRRTVGLHRPGEPQHSVLVSKLVLDAFCGPGRLAQHVNGDLRDCRLENLRWKKAP